jgi:hypothetical protein
MKITQTTLNRLAALEASRPVEHKPIDMDGVMGGIYLTIVAHHHGHKRPNEQLSSSRREIADCFGRVKAGASRPRAARGYGPDPTKAISAVATVRSAHCADRKDGRPKQRRREPSR